MAEWSGGGVAVDWVYDGSEVDFGLCVWSGFLIVTESGGGTLCRGPIIGSAIIRSLRC